MKQTSLGENKFERKTKSTRKWEFPNPMKLLEPWVEQVSLIVPRACGPRAKGRCQPFAAESKLRIHSLQRRFNFSDLAMESVDSDSGWLHQMLGMAANVNNVTQAHTRVQGEAIEVFADALYQDVRKRQDTQWQNAKARVRTKVEHLFEQVKVRCHGLAQNAVRLYHHLLSACNRCCADRTMDT